MDIINISARARQKGAQVSEKEKAHLIANNKFALIAFLIQQNAGYFNDVLKYQLGYNFLPFAPDHKAIGKVIESMIDKGEMQKVNEILAGFKFKPGTVISAEIKEALSNQNSQRIKIVGDITIQPKKCPPGSHLAKLQDGSYACIKDNT